MNGGNSSGSLPPRPRLRTSRSLPVVGGSEMSEPEHDVVESRPMRAAAPAPPAAAPAMITPSSSPAAAATADPMAGPDSSSRSNLALLPGGLPYGDSLSPSTSLTSITSYEEGEGVREGEDADEEANSSFASCWTPDTEAPTEADTSIERRGSDGDDGDYRIQPYGEEDTDVLAPAITSHFAPPRSQQHKQRQPQHQRSKNNRRRRRPGDALRQVSNDMFDSIFFAEGAKKSIRRGGKKGRGGTTATLLTAGTQSVAARSITTTQFLQLVKILLFAIWVLLSMAVVVHLHWFQDAPVAGGGQHPLVPIAGIGGPLTTTTSGTKGRLRKKSAVGVDIVEDSPSVPLIPPLLYRPAAPRTHIPLPLPPNKASVVLMNFSRPRMIQESSLMRTLLSHPNVDEVILLHSNPKTAFHFVHPKVINLDSTRQNDEMGLSLRFYFCQLAKNPWVIHVDDDMEFSVGTLSELFIEFARNPRRIVGRFGRDTVGDENSNSFNGYSSRSSHKQTEVVLTKLMMMERDTCSAFFEHAHLIWEDTVLNNGEGPLWNGEDIFMSLVANHVYGHDGIQANYAMDWLAVDNAPDKLKDYTDGKYDISGGMTGYRFWDWHWWQSLLRRNRHYAYRGKLWQTARRRLAEL